MTTLEQIMRDVTPLARLKVYQLRSENSQTHFISSGFKDVGIAYWMSEPDAKLFLRAAKNFAPLVKALEKLLECSAIVHACNQCANEANDVLAEALRKET